MQASLQPQQRRHGLCCCCFLCCFLGSALLIARFTGLTLCSLWRKGSCRSRRRLGGCGSVAAAGTSRRCLCTCCCRRAALLQGPLQLPPCPAACAPWLALLPTRPAGSRQRFAPCITNLCCLCFAGQVWRRRGQADCGAAAAGGGAGCGRGGRQPHPPGSAGAAQGCMLGLESAVPAQQSRAASAAGGGRQAGCRRCRTQCPKLPLNPTAALPQGEGAKPAATLEPIPEVEWWDARILADKSYGGAIDGEPAQVGWLGPGLEAPPGRCRQRGRRAATPRLQDWPLLLPRPLAALLPAPPPTSRWFSLACALPCSCVRAASLFTWSTPS